MIRLTNHPTRALVHSLWLVLCVASGLVVGLAAWLVGLPLWPAWWAGATLVPAILGLVQPSLERGAYFGWRRVASGVCRRSAGLLERTAFLVVWMVGRLGGDLRLRRPVGAGSGWVPRTTLSAEAYSGTGPDGDAPSSGWVTDLWNWGRGSGNGWIWALIPVLALLRQVGQESASAAPSTTTYTLY
jgi:hypothetical protein